MREQKERERELLELDRDIRTIFAYNLPLRATEKELFQFFSSAGKIVDVRIIMDRNTRKSKGFAYIEFANRVSTASGSYWYPKFNSQSPHEADKLAETLRTLLSLSSEELQTVMLWQFCKKLENVQEDIVKAMGLTGQICMGQAVMVKSSEVS